MTPWSTTFVLLLIFFLLSLTREICVQRVIRGSKCAEITFSFLFFFLVWLWSIPSICDQGDFMYVPERRIHDEYDDTKSVPLDLMFKTKIPLATAINALGVFFLRMSVGIGLAVTLPLRCLSRASKA